MLSLRPGSSRLWKVFACLLLSSLFVCSPTLAGVTAHFVTDSYFVSGGYGGNFNNASVEVYIDPSKTNWIAWHDHTTPDTYGTKELVGSNDWLGVDDWLYMTITNPAGLSTPRTRMDYNNGSGIPSGTQAVFYGSAAVAPDVKRGSYLLDEGGMFTSFFDNSGAGNYVFVFEFWDGYYGSRRNPDVYLLVDAEQIAGSSIPAPGAVLLATLGAGLVGCLRRRRAL